MAWITDGLAQIGAGLLSLLAGLGARTLFAFQATWRLFTPPFYPRIFVAQVAEFFYFSLPVVGLMLFTGMVLALQSHTGFERFSAEAAVPQVVALSIARELGPALRA